MALACPEVDEFGKVARGARLPWVRGWKKVNKRALRVDTVGAFKTKAHQGDTFQSGDDAG